MKGSLLRSGNKWMINYLDNDYTVTLDVRPGRVEELASVGAVLENNAIVDFVVEEVHNFPYRYAVPYINNDEEPKPKVRTKKQKKITVWISGFGMSDEEEIICDRYDASSHGYWYFFNINQHGNHEYIAAYPVNRTIIHKVEEIETEIK